MEPYKIVDRQPANGSFSYKLESISYWVKEEQLISLDELKEKFNNFPKEYNITLTEREAIAIAGFIFTFMGSDSILSSPGKYIDTGYRKILDKLGIENKNYLDLSDFKDYDQDYDYIMLKENHSEFEKIVKTIKKECQK